MLNGMTSTFGSIQKQFGESLGILNEDYKKYIDNMGKLSIESHKQFKKETGLSVDDIFNNIIQGK